jgi:hypothetical protein
MNQKNIDRLFQEKLKNLEATPNKKVWSNIESNLKKKKRKTIPIWWFSGVIAALFLLGLFLFPFIDMEVKLNKNDSETVITKAPIKVNEIQTVNSKSINSIIQKKNVEEKVLIANKKGSQIQKKKLVSTKNAMKKFFLTNISNEKKSVLAEKEALITSKNKNAFFNEKDKKKATKINKKTNNNKVDLNSIIDKKDTIIVTKSIKRKWAIAPVFGLLNSNSFSNSSPIDKNLSNSTIGKSSFSFGFQVAYQINKKWAIQTGIHQQEMSYVNNQVSVVSVTSRNSSNVVSFKNNASFSFDNSATIDFTQSAAINSSNFNGDLNQTFGYIEIPIEIKYNFLNTNKFDSQIVAGFSSLILNKNQINLSTQFISQFGEVNNLNNVNFSGNLGFDFNYLINKNWSLNFNPMFKAQLNTFSKNANGFSPFNVGIYTSVKYRF